MDIIIRNEKESETEEIGNIITMAFKTADVSDGDEAEYTSNLRNSKKYINKLAFVAVYKGKIVGQIMLTKFKIKTDHKEIESLLLAPICVLKEHRGKGISRMLIEKGFEESKKLGYKSIFLLGNHDYYKKFGFMYSVKFNIKNTDDIEDKFVLVKELEYSGLENIIGTITFQ